MALDELWEHQRRGSGRLQSQLASRRTIKNKKKKKTGRARKTFLALSLRGFFFLSNTTIWSDGSKPGERKRVKTYMTVSKIVALLRKTTVIRAQFESTFGRSGFWTVKSCHSLTRKLPSKAGDWTLDPVYQQQTHWNLSKGNVNSQESFPPPFLPLCFWILFMDQLPSLMECLFFDGGNYEKGLKNCEMRLNDQEKACNSERGGLEWCQRREPGWAQRKIQIWGKKPCRDYAAWIWNFEVVFRQRA